MLSQEQIKALPESPGVYFFKKGSRILYIGKATSLRDRVRSYLSHDLLLTRGQLIVQMIEEADSVDFQKTDSVIEALILEANLIKKFQPYHNSKEKDDKSFNYVIFTKEKFPRLMTIRGKELHSSDYLEKKNFKIEKVFGPFTQGLQLRTALKIIRKIFPYRDEKCTPKEDQKNQTGRPCFNRQIGLCPGVCTGEVSEKEYKKFVRHLVLFFEGKKSLLMKTLEREMKAEAKSHHFEKASESKRKIFAFQHIQDIALIKKETSSASDEHGFRIEAYDIAHISGTSTVGVMTVVENGEAKKADYRMFRIRGNFRGSDTGALREVLERRFKHSEWTFPNLIVIDGGIQQKNTAEAFLKIFEHSIPVVSVVKDERHRPDHFLGDEAFVEKYKDKILLSNSEAHRFAIKYHKNVRGRLR